MARTFGGDGKSHVIAILSAIFLAVLTQPGISHASGGAPVIDAGPDQVLALPARDLTLFGHAADPENDPLSVQWTMLSGPGSVGFSSSKGLATTVSFTTVGTYVFQLSVTDGTATVTSSTTVTVNAASSQTAFYVDPDYAGSGDGSAASPWTTLGGSHTSAPWVAINNALAAKPVIVYFSAREGGSDVPDESTLSIHIFRTDTGSNRLTIDGMSRFNANDANPMWNDYAGSSKMRIRVISSGSFSIGWDWGYPLTKKMDYVTIRGFEVTGNTGRIVFGGNNTVLEYVHSHDVVNIGATVQTHGATDSNCNDLGRVRGITIRNNLIERGHGEGIYVASNYQTVAYGGCPSYGNGHSDVLIEGNTIRDAGATGGQGDGIDLKAGLLNVTVRGNWVDHTLSSTDSQGITVSPVFGAARSNLIVENNVFANGPSNGIFMGGVNTAIVRNNLIYGNARAGIAFSGDSALGFYNSYVEVYSNTIYGSQNDAISVGLTNGITVRNNLLFGNNNGGYQASSWQSTGIDSDYNVLSSPGTCCGFTEGAYSITVTTTGGLVEDASNANFHLVSGSPAIDNGTNLAATGSDFDFDRLDRPSGGGWDIGAYELGSGSSNDTTPPTVWITAPRVNAVVSGTVTVTATATDNVRVAGVQFQLDGFNLGAEDTAAPYDVSWDTTGAANGGHTLTAVARDAAGHIATSTEVILTVGNVIPRNWWPETMFGINTVHLIIGLAAAAIVIYVVSRVLSRRRP